MSRITFRAIVFVSVLVALVFSFNLLVGAQDKTTGTGTTKQSKQDKTTTANDKSMSKGAQAGMTGSLSAADRKFVMEAAHGGMMEVELGRLATQKAMSDDVKQFGQRMVDDHGKANDELMQLASSKGITINHSMASTDTGSADSKMTATSTMSGDDAKMMKKHHEMVNKMSALSGAEFDRKYMDDMVKDHEKDVAAFERESTSGSDPDIKAWAAKTLPTLREHLRMARDTNMKVKGAAKSSTNTKSMTKN